MEKIKQAMETIKPENVGEAVQCFQDNKTAEAIAYLKENRDDIGEFCLQIKERYPKNDTTTPLLRIATLINELL